MPFVGQAGRGHGLGGGVRPAQRLFASFVSRGHIFGGTCRGCVTGGDCCHNRSAPFWLFLSRRWLWENTRSAPRPGDGPRATPRAHFLVISLVLADVQLVPLTRLYRSAPRTLPTQSKKKRKRRGRFASASSGSGSTDQGPYRRPVRQSKNKVIFFFFGFSVHLGQFE